MLKILNHIITKHGLNRGEVLTLRAKYSVLQNEISKESLIDRDSLAATAICWDVICKSA